MSNPEENDDQKYVVVINHEEQYSLWPDHSPVPDGWRAVFGPEDKATCLEYVKENWTDMRPKSLRDADALIH